MSWTDSAAWRDGTALVADDGAEVSHCCLKCDQQVASVHSRRFTWHNPNLYALIIFGLVPYVLVAMIVRKTATVRLGLCESHARTRKRLITSAWLTFAAGMGCFAWAVKIRMVQPDIPSIIIFGGIGFTFAAPILAFVASKYIGKATKVEGGRVWIDGANEPFLSQLHDYSIVHSFDRTQT